MNNFDGMNKQYSIPKLKEGTYQFARNIILTSKYTSVKNEEGAKKVDTIPGLVIGEIVTNTHIVYFSTDLEYSYIGYKELFTSNTKYKNVIKSKYFNFNINCPIEGVYYYNYKNELIVGWCDGLFENSNPPYLLNIFNLPFELDSNKELVNSKEINKAKWFVYSNEPIYNINYAGSGAVQADTMHITMTYCLEDGTELFWFPIDTMAYPKTGLDNIDYRLVELTLLDLDKSFSYFKIGFIINKDGASSGYKSDVFKISDYSSFIHRIDSLNNYTSISVEELAINTTVINRASTITLDDNQVFFGGITTQETEEDNLQKYINLLDIRFHVIDTLTEYNVYKEELKGKDTHPSLLPNEVYSFKLKAKRLDGTYTDSFQIPNLTRLNTGIMPDSDYFAYNLNKELFDRPIYKVNAFNNALLVKNNAKFLGHVDAEYRAGEFYSHETYPNIDDYNSTSVGGQDLRNLPINFHRVPSTYTITSELGNGMGMNIDDSNPNRIVIYPKVINMDKLPKSITDKYQSFTLEIVKRTKGNCIIEDTGLLIRSSIKTIKDGGVENSHLSLINSYMPFAFDDDLVNNYKSVYGFSNFISHQAYHKKPSYTKNCIIECNMVKNLNNSYPIKYGEFKTTLTELFKNINEAYFVGDTMLPNNPFPYGYLKDYKYYEESRANNLTRFGQNQLIFNIDSYNKVGDTLKYNYYNPLVVTDDAIGMALQTVTVATFFSSKITYKFVDSEFYNNASKVNGFQSYYMYNFPSNAYALYCDVINLNSGLYKLDSSDLVTIGKFKLDDADKFIIGGDIFLNNKIDIYLTQVSSENNNYIRFIPIVVRQIASTINNSLVKSVTIDSKLTDSKIFTYATYFINNEKGLNILNALNLKIEALTSLVGDSSRLNDLVGSTSIEVSRDVFINKFPFRVLKSSKIQTENISTRNIRLFKPNDYYDMPNDKGMIVALRAVNRKLYIQQMYSLFISEVRDNLLSGTEDSSVYLGQSNFLDRIPTEVLQSGNLGHVGCQSKFACTIFRGGLIVIDMLQGKIFIITDSVKEVSAQLMRIFYREKLPLPITDNTRYTDLGYTSVDNPYMGLGYSVTFDGEYERIIFTKQHYELKDGVDINNYNYNGEVYIAKDNKSLLNKEDSNIYNNKSLTFSISVENLATICSHDYTPNFYNVSDTKLFYNKNRFNSLSCDIFEMNSKEVNFGEHDGKIVESYIDIPFNKRLDLSKLYQALYWNTEVEEDGVILPYETLSKVMLYNYNQCSGIIDLELNTYSKVRNAEGIWQFNEFRDLLKDINLPIIDSDGNLNTDNINYNKNYFNKSNFIGIFIVARLYFKNGTRKSTLLHNVNIKSIISKR